MGSVLAQNQRLFVHEWTPPAPCDLYSPVQDLALLPAPLPGRILLPLSRVNHKRKFILDNHRHVILIDDAPDLQPLLALQFRGIPRVSVEWVARGAAGCLGVRTGCGECGVPVVLEKFHESYVQNYLNAFLFYGVRTWAYGRVEDYLKAQCSNPYLVCSSFELEQLASRVQFTQGQERPLTILCFCNKAHYTLPKKTEFLLQKRAIDYQLFQNILEIIDKLVSESLTSPRGTPSRTERVLLYLNEKEKEMDYLLKMAKRAEKSIRNLKVVKVSSRGSLLEKVDKCDYSIVVVSNDIKEMRNELEMHENLEEQGLEDRTIFIRRDAEMGEKFIHRLQNVTLKHKYVKTQITDKPLIFFGSLEFFKHVLRNYPHLRFKKFIDSNKEKAELRRFLPIRTEVVLTSLKVCPCNEEYAATIECKVIHLRSKMNTFKSIDRPDPKTCPLEIWCSDEAEIVQHFGSPSEESQLLRLNFNYPLKKMSYIGKIINEIFLKFKEKKTILKNSLDNSIFLFSCEHYTLDQISNFLMKFFTHKLLGNYEQDCLFQHLKYLLYAEIVTLRNVRAFEEDVVIHLERDESDNIYELAKKVVELMMDHPLFLEEVNNIWTLFLHQDRAEYLNNCQILLFLLFLAFNKTNFAHYRDEKLENLLLVVKPNAITYDLEEVAAFTLKNRSNFVYNIDFMICQEFDPHQTYPDNPIIIRVEGNELTNFNLYMPIWKKKNQIMIPPLTKFELNNKPDREYILKLSLSSQQKLLEKFSQHFLEENVGQLKLFQEEREMRKLDVFLESMCHGKYETAGYILKKLMKQESMMNNDLMNAYGILYHLKKGEIELAEAKLRMDKYYEMLHSAINSVKEGQVHPSQKAFCVPSVFQSNKRIEESNKEYQNLEETEHESESVQNSAMINTDPEMIRKLTSDYKLINYRVEKGRSPSYILRSLNGEPRKKSKNSNSIPIHYNRGKDPTSTSLTDAISEHSKDEAEMTIMISPPVKLSSSGENMMGVSTFGNKFTYDEPAKCEMRDSRDKRCELSKKVSSKSESKSQLGDKSYQFEDAINQSDLPSLTRKSSSIKQSLFLQMEIEKNKENNFAQTVQTDSKIGTGTFNFRADQSDSHFREEDEEEIIEEVEDNDMDPVEEQLESEKQSQPSEKNLFKYTASDLDYFKFNLSSNGSKLFPIKRKLNRMPKKSFNQGFTPHLILQPKLINIDEESSQLSQSNNLKSLQSIDKENRSDLLDSTRTNPNKLFTFCRNEDNRRKMSFSDNGTGLLNNLSALSKKSASKPQAKNPLFFVFDEQQNNSLIEMNSISSIEVEEAEQIHPEEELEQPYFKR